jgi:hypothetical protein
LDDLAGKLGIARELLKKRITFWVNNQILREVQKDVYQLIEEVGAQGEFFCLFLLFLS